MRREDQDGLIGARDNAFSDGDQLLLLIEDAQARGFPFAGVELERSTGRSLYAPGLDLRQRNLEFGSMPNALLDHRLDGHAGQVGKQAI